MSSKPPVVKIGLGPGRTYALTGFEDFENWMRRNHPRYAQTYGQALYIGMTERDRLRLLVSAISAHAMALGDNITAHLAKYGMPPPGPFALAMDEFELVAVEELTRLREAAAYGAMAREVLERTGNANPLEFV